MRTSYLSVWAVLAAARAERQVTRQGSRRRQWTMTWVSHPLTSIVHQKSSIVHRHYIESSSSDVVLACVYTA